MLSLLRAIVRAIAEANALSPERGPTTKRSGSKGSNFRGRCGRQLHEERGWAQRGDTLHGYFRTRLGAVEGRIEHAASSSPEFYVINPPIRLLSGRHGPCFRERRRNVYWVHFSPAPKDIVAGILRIEHCIEESLA